MSENTENPNDVNGDLLNTNYSQNNDNKNHENAQILSSSENSSSQNSSILPNPPSNTQIDGSSSLLADPVEIVNNNNVRQPPLSHVISNFPPLPENVQQYFSVFVDRIDNLEKENLIFLRIIKKLSAKIEILENYNSINLEEKNDRKNEIEEEVGLLCSIPPPSYSISKKTGLLPTSAGPLFNTPINYQNTRLPVPSSSSSSSSSIFSHVLHSMSSQNPNTSSINPANTADLFEKSFAITMQSQNNPNNFLFNQNQLNNTNFDVSNDNSEPLALDSFGFPINPHQQGILRTPLEDNPFDGGIGNNNNNINNNINNNNNNGNRRGRRDRDGDGGGYGRRGGFNSSSDNYRKRNQQW
jgi:hypothetical protein